MYHSISGASHPLQTEEQEIGIDPLQSYGNKPDEDASNENGRVQLTLDSDGIFLSYSKEWEELFVNNNYLATIRLKGINGQLRSSRFRSVCWKLFLNVLPSDRNHWITKTIKSRALYNNVKEIHITNPRKAGQQDLMINNPLSQDEGSLWNKFFQDKELRSMIEQDVKRTFPEMQYFQEENVRKILTDILFCYARENEQLLYKQGMHELLAPIVFILHCDHQAFLHASEAAQPSEEMNVLLNPDYLEHDAYAMFTHLMKTAEHWFSTYEHDSQKEKDAVMTPIPFARPQDLGPSIAIVAKVNQIQDHLLKKHDTELYMHLNRLEIAPQIYGLRWIRLLFGREFLLQDLLVVWDALFADSITLDLVDYIFLAMLLYIRDALISSNYQTCLGLLMHYPPIGDVHSLILKALFLRDPKLLSTSKVNGKAGNIQEVILQEHLEKEDEILVSLAGLKQIKDILKGSLRFNQSQLEAEENEQITIEDDHYCSTNQSKRAVEKIENPSAPKQFVPLLKEATDHPGRSPIKRHSDDYILVSKKEGNVSASDQEQTLPASQDMNMKIEAPCHTSLAFTDPLLGSMSASSSNLSSSPEDSNSNNSKDSDFTIVSPLEM
ncbi:TBC1 domain family member 5 [Thamnophis elegans]|uniref:TBC1 domain family member 5 n=1 Tax=Thamnophis elegans TaxID=35005 RepID=UPI001378D637|nr:TBC1 domain family member 5 [Thamnophis elegans]